LDKAEAISVLKELFIVCPEIGQAVFVSLDPVKTNENAQRLYKIRLGMYLDKQLRDCMENVLAAHKLNIAGGRDLVTIYRATVLC
jgi:hypothetical protein